MYGKVFLAFVVATALGTTAQADPWKDESGHGGWGRGYGEFKHQWKGEFRGGARGKGYWDGYFKDRRVGPPPWAGRPEAHRYYAAPRYEEYYCRNRYVRQYYPAPRYPAPSPVYFEFRGGLEL